MGLDMNDEQYWDCDRCEERYPRSYMPYEVTRKWHTVEGDRIDDRVEWLCGDCFTFKRHFEEKQLISWKRGESPNGETV